MLWLWLVYVFKKWSFGVLTVWQHHMEQSYIMIRKILNWSYHYFKLHQSIILVIYFIYFLWMFHTLVTTIVSVLCFSLQWIIKTGEHLPWCCTAINFNTFSKKCIEIQCRHSFKEIVGSVLRRNAKFSAL